MKSKIKVFNNSRVNQGIENDVFLHNFILKCDGQSFHSVTDNLYE